MGTVGRTIAQLAGTAVLRAGALLAGFTVTVGVAGAAWGAQDVLLTMAGRTGGEPIAVEGSISDVRAGEPGSTLRLTLRNPSTSPREVTRVTAVVTHTDDPACAAGHLSAGDWTGRVTVPARGVAHVTLRVAVSDRLPARCAGVTWGLLYTAY